MYYFDIFESYNEYSLPRLLSEVNVLRMTFSEIRKKEVINQRDGQKIGYADDLNIDSNHARIISLIVFGRPRFFGLFGYKTDCVIPWENIRLLGEDTILVDFSVQKMPKKAKKRNKFVTICN